MTADYATLALRQLIENADSNTYPNITELPIYVSTEDGSKTYPCITIEDTGGTEHEVLRGVFDPLEVDITLRTVPNTSESDGTTQEEHRAMSNELYNLLGNTDAIDYLNNYTGLKCFDIRDIEVSNEREDGKNSTELAMSIVCCQQLTT